MNLQHVHTHIPGALVLQCCTVSLASLPLLHGQSQNVDSAAPAAIMGLKQAYMLQGPHALWPRTCQVAALCCCAHLQPCRSLTSCRKRASRPAWPHDGHHLSWPRCCDCAARTHKRFHAHARVHAHTDIETHENARDSARAWFDREQATPEGLSDQSHPAWIWSVTLE